MEKTDRSGRLLASFFSLVLGFVPPVFLFLVFWWSSIFFVKETDIFKAAAMGLCIGIAISMAGIKRWRANIYRLNRAVLISVYLFYMVGIFGFFMGVPVFNILPGIIAGAYVAAKSRDSKGKAALFRRQLLQVQRFGFFALLPFLAASTYLALADTYTSANLRGMFRLPFEPTQVHISALIVVGGLTLLVLQHLLTGAIAKTVYQLRRTR